MSGVHGKASSRMCGSRGRCVEGLSEDCVCVSVMDGAESDGAADGLLRDVQFCLRKCALTRLIEHCEW